MHPLSEGIHFIFYLLFFLPQFKGIFCFIYVILSHLPSHKLGLNSTILYFIGFKKVTFQLYAFV